MIRKILTASGAAALTMGAVAIGVAQATPAASSVCNVAGSVTITPGLSFTNQAATLKSAGTLKGCTGGGPTTGTFSSTTHGSSLSCASGTSTGTQVITFTGGTKSTATIKVTTSGTTAKITGTVTAGVGKGKKIASTLTFTPKSGTNCTTVLLTKATFKGSSTTQ